ncbi:MAG: ABC transporter ATP-binding protein [Actinobacteria bacterium]|nr:ABC transporter ATP-binding protein [Actinomycetota bacterium]MBU1943222.1 ABC transporter ATP-binding protein [Actinomycetota bacterium]MBU2686219.1 ABC transporter ATP-binding protein [Actinomycetota bacterium]
MLEVDDVSKTFQVKAGDVTAVDRVSFTADAGEVTTIVGPSGSGKTTLLYVIGSLEKPDSGTIEVAGHNILAPSADLIDYRRESVGFVFQFFNLIPTLTALENVMLPMDILGTSPEEQRTRATGLLERMGIDGRLLKARPNKMSGGENQRVAIARALANDPDVILADEPTGNLDTATGQTVIAILSALAKENGKCILMVTHDESILNVSDRAFHMTDGRLSEITVRQTRPGDGARLGG